MKGSYEWTIHSPSSRVLQGYKRTVCCLQQQQVGSHELLRRGSPDMETVLRLPETACFCLRLPETALLLPEIARHRTQCSQIQKLVQSLT
jgi:hypothetical protein